MEKKDSFFCYILNSVTNAVVIEFFHRLLDFILFPFILNLSFYIGVDIKSLNYKCFSVNNNIVVLAVLYVFFSSIILYIGRRILCL